MRDAHSLAAIRSTLQYVLGSDVPSEHKTILMEALTRLLRDEQSEEDRRFVDAQMRAWQPHELAHLNRALSGKRAKSWQDADETLVLVASQLRRRAEEVRTKAVECGFAVAVDFATAKAAASHPHDHDD